MELGILELVACAATFLILVYYYLTSTFNFWKVRGVQGPEPKPLFGNFKDVMFNKISLGDFCKELYDEYPDAPAIGIFARREPILIVKDPDYIKDILIKHFSSWVNRGIRIHEKVEPLASHLFALEAERWRPMRVSLSPVFTSGKLKEMFYLLLECAQQFEGFLEKYTASHPVIECREITAKFSTDVIGVCAFGLKMNALSDEDSRFRKMGRMIFTLTRWRQFRILLQQSLPWLFDLLGPLLADTEMNDFFISTVRDTMDYRKKNNVKRHDFIDLLLEIKENPKKLNGIEVTDSLLTAQAFVFFVAGFETSSTTMSNALYELALHPDIQQKLREEIIRELNENNGSIKYESIRNMEYLHKVFCETLRKYPPVTVLMRAAGEKFTFSDGKLTVPKDQKVFIPAYAIQRDPKIYPDPETFDPERFSEENIKTRHPSFYLPFGDGPRNCIGARFANYQTKVGLITILKNYEIKVCDSTCLPYVNDPKAFLLTPVGGINLKFVKLNQSKS